MRRCGRQWVFDRALPRLKIRAFTDTFTRMTLPGHPRIAINPAICGGRPIVAGSRMRVRDILEMLAGGATPAEITADFPYVGEADVRAVLAYAAGLADHPVGYRQQKRRDRQVIRTEDLDDETLQVILNAEPGERSKALNYLMDDTAAG